MDCTLSLSYRGEMADSSMLSFYDTAHALGGFERVISLTIHLLLNGEVITQSPSAKGFFVLIAPPEKGSWKIKALVGVGVTAAAFGTAAPDTQFGWLAKSAVEYVIQETLGFTPNFEETLGAQIREYRASSRRVPIHRGLDESRFDSVIEKCEAGLKSLHRPIIFSETANRATIEYQVARESGQLDLSIDSDTYEYVSSLYRASSIERFCGIISSYNVNTFKGRIYDPILMRTIPFELSTAARNLKARTLIGASLNSNAVRDRREIGKANTDVCFEAFRNSSNSGRLKGLYVVDVSAPS